MHTTEVNYSNQIYIRYLFKQLGTIFLTKRIIAKLHAVKTNLLKTFNPPSESLERKT